MKAITVNCKMQLNYPRILAIAAVIICLCAASCGATTYYVAPGGDDGNDGLSLGTAWATISNGDANGHVQAGDTVLVEAGSYAPQNPTTGVGLYNVGGVTYQATNGAVTIDFGSPTGAASKYGFDIYGNLQGIVVNGFTIANCQKGISVDGGANQITIKNCRIGNIAGNTASGGHCWGIYLAQNSDNSIVENNAIYNVIADQGGSGYAESLYNDGANAHIFNNTICGSFYGVVNDKDATGTVFKNNIMMNCNADSAGYGIGNWASSFTASNNLFYNDTRNGATGYTSTNDVLADPTFVNVALNDFRLMVGSPAIDAGVNVGLPYIGSAPDIGAYEGGVNPPPVVVGLVINSDCGFPIQGVTVTEPISGLNTVTAADGTYSLTLPAAAGTYNIRASYRGTTQTQSVTVVMGSTVTANFTLTLSPAHTYYVTPGGSNSNNGLTHATAWATIDYADGAGKLVAGDQLLIDAGTYPVTKVYAVVLQHGGSPGDPVIYTAVGGTALLNVSAEPSNAIGCSVSITHDIVLDGFQITGLVPGGVGFEIDSSARVILRNSQSSGGNYGVYMGGATSPVVRNNVFTGSSVAAIDIDSCSNCSVIQNVIHDVVPFGVKAYTSPNTLIYNNTLNNMGSGVFVADDSPNTIVRNNIMAYCTDSAGYGISVLDSTATASNFSNNLFYNDTRNGANYYKYTNDVIGADPKFVNAAGFDFHLQDSSPAIDAGINVGLPYTGPAPDIGAFETTQGSYVTGTVTNGADNTGLGGATVQDTGSGLSTTTKSDGTYSLRLNPAGGTFAVQASDQGYTQTASVTIPAGGTVTQNFTLTLSAPAHTYYVTPTGSNSNDGLTHATAWATIDYADSAGKLVPGDLLLIDAGTYPVTKTFAVQLTHGGAAGNPITYKVVGGMAVLNMSSSYSNGFLVQNTHDIVLDGFQVVGLNAAQNGFYLTGADRITVRNCQVSCVSTTAGTVGLRVMTCQSPTLRNNIINGLKYGMYVSACPNASVIDNVVHDSYYIGADILSSPNTVLYNNTFNSNVQGTYISGVDSPSSAIRNNIWANNPTSYGISQFGVETTSNNLFFNNKNNYVNGYVSNNDVINADPMFVNAAAFDYGLLPGSPAIDAGYNVGLPYSGGAPDIGAYETSSGITAIRNLADGASVSLTNTNVVTAGSGVFTDGSCYIEDTSRVAGIKVVLQSGLTTLTLGQGITLTGTMATDTNGQRYVLVSSWAAGTANPVTRLGVSARSLTFHGPSVVGLLTKLWGKVTSSGTGSIVVDDGSGNPVTVILNAQPGGTFTNIPSASRYVGITGLVGLSKQGSNVTTVIYPRGQGDITIYN